VAVVATGVALNTSIEVLSNHDLAGFYPEVVVKALPDFQLIT
jgi:hypothetical protein